MTNPGSGYTLAPLPKKPYSLIIAGVLLLLASCAAAAYLIATKRPTHKSGSANVSASKTIEQSGDSALQAYTEAKELFAAGKRYSALERLKKAQETTDREILSLAGALERRLQAAIQMDQAQIQINAGKWKEATFHLQKVLALDPSPEAERLLKQANAHSALGPVALPSHRSRSSVTRR